MRQRRNAFNEGLEENVDKLWHDLEKYQVSCFGLIVSCSGFYFNLTTRHVHVIQGLVRCHKIVKYLVKPQTFTHSLAHMQLSNRIEMDHALFDKFLGENACHICGFQQTFCKNLS